MKWLVAVLLFAATPAAAQTFAPPASNQQKIDQLLTLLRDPEIQGWLMEREEPREIDEGPGTAFAKWEAATHQRLRAAIIAAPRIPSEISKTATRIRGDALSRGYAPVLLMMGGIFLSGALAEAWFRRRRGTRSILDHFLPISVFSLAMAIVFFAIPWPPLGRIVMFSYLAAFVIYRLVSTSIGLAIADPRIRTRARLFFGMATFAVASAAAGQALGVDAAVRQAISYLFSFVLICIALELLWVTVKRRRAFRFALCLAAIATWIVWCVDLPGLFWLGIYAFLLPPLLRAADIATQATGLAADRPLANVLLVRGARALIISAALIWLAIVWHINDYSLARQSPEATALLYGLLKSVIVLIIADLTWHLARTAIEQRIKMPAVPGEDKNRHSATATRLHTLLPIFRNVLAVIVIVVTALTVLAELGVEIGPLIAGAGIFGVALGFGSQTLVKDVISGIFYMLDDAFRVGEYIQAKSYKGTVEGFSLRSVRLRHHRGPVFTVPFGELGAVENMSRDWGVVKFRVSVGYDTDVEKARKLTKKIGATLLEDPELGPLFIEPLKMKGIEEFGDYGMELSFGMTLHPSPMQSFIRRRANLLLREAFSENGIAFATPSVHVGGDERQAAAAAATAALMPQAKTTAPAP